MPSTDTSADHEYLGLSTWASLQGQDATDSGGADVGEELQVSTHTVNVACHIIFHGAHTLVSTYNIVSAPAKPVYMLAAEWHQHGYMRCTKAEGNAHATSQPWHSSLFSRMLSFAMHSLPHMPAQIAQLPPLEVPSEPPGGDALAEQMDQLQVSVFVSC